ncbi:Nuclear RNA export factor 1 [Diplonema papillatum]|nr:Nuclear RNA export factor 1 [Diplonema papillatum]
MIRPSQFNTDLANTLSCNFNAKSFVDVVFEILEDDFPTIESLSIAGNSITSLGYFRAAAEEHHQLGFIRNLDLSNNKLHSFKELEMLKPFKLAEVILKGNPIAQSKDYAKEVISKLPTVEMIDQENVVELRSSLRPSFPPVNDTFYFAEGTKDVVFEFCRMFFAAIDEKAFDSELINAYDSNCLFTLTTGQDLTIGSGVKAEQIIRNLRDAGHNLCKLKNEAAPAKTVHKGRIEAVEVLKKKVYSGMSTTHDLQTFQVDTMSHGSLSPPVISANVHGIVEFTSQSPSGKTSSFKRCFDRVLVLAPAPAGSQWPAILVNDMLHLRAHRKSVVLKPANDDSAPPSVEEARRKMLATVMSSNTKLTIEYATMCLDAANWDPVAAEQLFKEKQSELPPEAWKQ